MVPRPFYLWWMSTLVSGQDKQSDLDTPLFPLLGVLWLSVPLLSSIYSLPELMPYFGQMVWKAVGERFWWWFGVVVRQRCCRCDECCRSRWLAGEDPVRWGRSCSAVYLGVVLIRQRLYRLILIAWVLGNLIMLGCKDGLVVTFCFATRTRRIQVRRTVFYAGKWTKCREKLVYKLQTIIR